MVDGFLDQLLQDSDFTLFPILEQCNQMLPQMNPQSIKVYASFLVAVAQRIDALDTSTKAALMKCYYVLVHHLPIPQIAFLSLERDEKATLNALLVKCDELCKLFFKKFCEDGTTEAIDALLPQKSGELVHFTWRNFVKAFGPKMEIHAQSVAAWCESFKVACEANPGDLKLALQGTNCTTVLLRSALAFSKTLPVELLSSLLKVAGFFYDALQSCKVSEMRERQGRLSREVAQLVAERPDLIEMIPEGSDLFWFLVKELRSVEGLPALRKLKRIGRLLCNNPALASQIPGFHLNGTLFLEQTLRESIGWRQLLFLAAKAQVNDDLILRSQLLLAVKLALLGRGLDELAEIGRREFAQGVHSLKTCLLLSVFPFSLLPRGVDGQLIDALIAELCFSLKNSSKRAGNDLLAEALANVVNECFDSLKADKFSMIVSILPSINAPKALHKLTRPLLQLKDASLLPVLDAAGNRCAFVDACALIRALPFLKTLRDSERTARLVIEKFDRLVPKSLPLATNPLLMHFLLHSLYVFLKYSTDVSCITRPFLKAHTESIAAYAQGFVPAWSGGEFSIEAEDSIWSSFTKPSQTGHRRAQVCFGVERDTGALLRAAVKILQGQAEALIQSGDEEAMKRLTGIIQLITI